MRTLSLLAALGLLVPAMSAGAQCADGSPPPCRTQTVAAAAPRRVNPPLDERAWIVVPFDNLAKSPDIDWLRSAAVNLLYLDMSRWKDIRVIDDERVADLMRETPEAASGALSLSAAQAMARRAGAGRLVMGDVLRLGSRTVITAKVFDTRTGERIRSVSEQTTVPDSVLPLFGRLAQKVLSVEPPAGADLGAIGTSRVDAYQEYLEGVAALNRFDLDEARRRLQRAIALDSSFALAHLKMSIVIGWGFPGDPGQREHAEAAARLTGGLPARERALIAGQLQQATGQWTDACETYAGLLATDSLDLEALYGRAECLYHNRTVEAIGGDTTRLRFRADWQESLRTFQKVLALDPQYHLAYQHIVDMFMSEQHSPAQYCVGPICSGSYVGFLIRHGDTLVIAPVDSRTDSTKLRRQAEEYARTRSRILNISTAGRVAESWIAAAPNERRALLALATVRLAEGRVAEADVAMSRVGTTGSLFEELRRIFARMEIAVKLDRSAEAVRLYDSVRATTTQVPGSEMRLGNSISGYGPPLGRLAEFDSLLEANLRGAPPQVLLFQRLAIHAVVGAPLTDSLAITEAAVFEQLRAARGTAAATHMITSTQAFALRLARLTWPAIDSTVADHKLRPALALGRRDTAGVRRAAMALDSLLRVAVASGGSDSGFAVIAADAYLTLSDTASALRSLRYALDTAAATSPYFPLSSAGWTAAYFAPRMMLLRADLAAARGQKEEAREWYRRFTELWSGAVPELQPLVERARKARAAL